MTVVCPQCETPWRRVRSRSERRLLDAAFAGRETVLQPRVRRFFCTTHDCVRKVSEWIDEVTARGARVGVVARSLL